MPLGLGVKGYLEALLLVGTLMFRVVIVKPMRYGNVIKQPEITLAQAVGNGLHVGDTKAGGANGIGGLYLWGIQYAGNGFTGKRAQGYPVVTSDFVGITAVFCFQIKMGVGGGNAFGTGGIETDEFVFVIPCFVG